MESDIKIIFHLAGPAPETESAAKEKIERKKNGSICSARYNHIENSEALDQYFAPTTKIDQAKTGEKKDQGSIQHNTLAVARTG
jgi:hypothetical protein